MPGEYGAAPLANETDRTLPAMWHNSGMKFLFGLAIGGAIGYVLGTHDGRERFDEIVAAVSEVIGEETVAQITEFLDQSGAEMRKASDASVDAASEVVDSAAETLQEAVDES
jgi:hypothetical protein